MMINQFSAQKFCAKALAVVGIALCPTVLLHPENTQNPCDVFSRIYKNGEWGRNAEGEGISGMGSVAANALPYMKMLQEFIIKYRIESVVDAGCGDWELSKLIDWGSIDYYGFDAAAEVIKNNTTRYGSAKRHFYAGDAMHTDLPKADLLICKDVLQHLPNSFIDAFISQLGKYKYCLVTNDIAFEPQYDRKLNLDIPMGSGRCVDLTKAPFNIKGIPLMRYPSDGHTKEVLLIVRDDD
jgi:SAM-dependent methyltransferase